MSIILSEIKKKVVRLLGDIVKETEGENPCDGVTISGNVYSSEILEDGIQAAIRRVSMKYWKNSYYDISEEGVTEVALPGDLIDIEGVFDNSLGKFIPKAAFSLDDPLEAISDDANAYIEYPGGSITFINELSSDGARIYYIAHWEIPVSESDTLECPDICINAICLYAASHCLLRSASESGDIAQFKTRIDSGRPIDIPALVLSDFFLRRYENELSTIPVKMRNG